MVIESRLDVFFADTVLIIQDFSRMQILHMFLPMLL